MAENKKSFILYADLITIVEKLIIQDRDNKTNYAGELFLHILQYVNDQDPIPIDFIIEMTFEPIKLQLKRDLQKWESNVEQRRQAGIRSAEVRKEKANEKQRALTTVERDSTNPTDTVNVNDTVNEIYREKDHLRITWNEMNKLIDEFGEQKADEYINQVLNYRKNAKYKSLYLTALKWLRRDFKKPSKEKNQVLA